MTSYALFPGSLDHAPEGSPEVILLVEDDDSVRNLAKKILEARGYIVLDAKNGREGLLACETHKGTIDLLLSDVVMPELEGPELAERALSMRPDLKVLLVSGYTPGEVLKENIRKRTAFLQKPFSPADLAYKVREVLDAPRRTEHSG